MSESKTTENVAALSYNPDGKNVNKVTVSGRGKVNIHAASGGASGTNTKNIATAMHGAGDLLITDDAKTNVGEVRKDSKLKEELKKANVLGCPEKTLDEIVTELEEQLGVFTSDDFKYIELDALKNMKTLKGAQLARLEKYANSIRGKPKSLQD